MKKTKGFFGEFKEFITKGNVLDMAVGVIIATAFGAITTTLVNNVFMPLIGYLFGGIDLAKLYITLRAAEFDAAGEVVTEAVVIGIGAFLSAVINFVIVAFIVFLIVIIVYHSISIEVDKTREVITLQRHTLLLIEILHLFYYIIWMRILFALGNRGEKQFVVNLSIVITPCFSVFSKTFAAVRLDSAVSSC